MAIIKLTQKTFSKAISRRIDEFVSSGLLAAALMGGKEKMKEFVASMPDENTLWVNTDHVVAASAPIKAAETGEVVFRIYFDHPDRNENPVWVLGKDYGDFLMAWNGSVRYVNEGEYEVPNGYRAVSIEDGCKVIVEKRGEI